MDSVETRRLLGTPPARPRGRWFSMPVSKAWERLARSRETPRVELAVMIVFMTWANNEGIIVATLDQVADAVRYDRGHTSDAINALIERDYLVKVKRCVYRIPDTVCVPANREARGLC